MILVSKTPLKNTIFPIQVSALLLKKDVPEPINKLHIGINCNFTFFLIHTNLIHVVNLQTDKR